MIVEFIDENGGGLGVRLRKAREEESEIRVSRRTQKGPPRDTAAKINWPIWIRRLCRGVSVCQFA
jgi:hypothetical protein